MFAGHHKTYNVHGLKALLQEIDVPLAELGVQDGETLSPVPALVPFPKSSLNTNYVQPDIEHSSFELTQIDGYANQLKTDDFPLTNYIGESLGGWGE